MIIIIDCGSQFTHLIQKRFKTMGLMSVVKTAGYIPDGNEAGFVISGGPQSVSDSDIQINPNILRGPKPVLAICFGMQYVAKHLFGCRIYSGSPEHGPVLVTDDAQMSVVWMNHGDSVDPVGHSFDVALFSAGGGLAAFVKDHVIATQFHPEVHHTENGQKWFDMFVAKCDGNLLMKSTDVLDDVMAECKDIKEPVTVFLSGGVDSMVLASLLAQYTSVRTVFFDHGFVRVDDEEVCRSLFPDTQVHKTNLVSKIVGKAAEDKRRVIGEAFEDFSNGVTFAISGFLAQGTIYPDIIESGGTKLASKIKTHHNRTPGLIKLVKEGRLLEPFRNLYKDDVRRLGRKLGLPLSVINRRPFPGPGYSVRIIENDSLFQPQSSDHGVVVPLYTTGIQGDARKSGYFQICDKETHQMPSSCVRSIHSIAGNDVKNLRMNVTTGEYRSLLVKLRELDFVLQNLLDKYACFNVWQCPLVIIPIGTAKKTCSLVIRPLSSLDGMTAAGATLPEELLKEFCNLALFRFSNVFLDLTPKPPATIEWM